MKKLSLIILFGIILSNAIFANEEQSPFELEVTQGWRQDKLSASAIHKKFPVKGKASLKNINIYEPRVRARLNMGNWFLRADGGYGEIKKSTGKLSVLGFHANHDIMGGMTRDAKVSFGRDFFLNSRTTLSPMIGYLYGEEKINTDYSRYIKVPLRWHAPFVGLRFATRPGENWLLYGEYNFACAPLKKIKGYGNIGVVGLGYNITRNLMVKAEYEYSDIQVHITRFNIKGHAKLISKTARLVLSYAF